MTVLERSSERRRYRRFPAAELKAQLKSSQGLFSKWIDVDVSDFNAHGMALVLNEEPELNEAMSIRLMLVMDMGEIKVSPLEATTQNKVKNDQLWRVGIEFDEKSFSKLDDTATKLKRIDQILEKSYALRNRLESQL